MSVEQHSISKDRIIEDSEPTQPDFMISLSKDINHIFPECYTP